MRATNSLDAPADAPALEVATGVSCTLVHDTMSNNDVAALAGMMLRMMLRRPRCTRQRTGLFRCGRDGELLMRRLRNGREFLRALVRNESVAIGHLHFGQRRGVER